MLITFKALLSDDMKLHGPFNNWEGEKMIYNPKSGKFELSVDFTDTLLFKFTKNGEWVLGDYDVVEDKEGHVNHRVFYNEKKPGMFKKLMSMKRPKNPNFNESAVENEESHDPEEIVIAEAVANVPMETEDSPKENSSEVGKVAEGNQKPSNESIKELAEEVTEDSAVRKSSAFSKFGSMFRSRSASKSTNLESHTDESHKINMPGAKVEDTPAVETTNQGVESTTEPETNFEHNKKHETPKPAEPADVEVLTDDKMEDAAAVPEKIDEKMSPVDTERKQSDYIPEERQKKATLLKRIKSKWNKLVK
eukprot:NODE_245_length_12995_cov_0.297922.p1 type:complete len:307 gc:universal NODE_245_length_12995_cov_0.297922:5373-4453(-)